MGIINKRRRIIAIGRSANGQPFQVTTTPADFAEAVADVDSRPVAQWTVAQHDAIDNEVIGAEFSRTPFLY
jgi:hypothetical protein